MHRRTQIVVCSVCALVFCFPLVLFLAGVRPTVNENRPLAQRPALDGSSLVDADSYAQLGQYLTDRFPYRDRLIDLDADLDAALSFDGTAATGNPLVVAGANDWYFYGDSLRSDCPSPPPGEFLTVGDAAVARAASSGIDVMFLVAPDKAVIHPEHLAGPIGLAGLLGLDSDTPRCSDAWMQTIETATPEHDWLHPLAVGIRERQRSFPDEPVFYRTDTHWTDLGSLAMVEEIVRRADSSLWDPSQFSIIDFGPQTHDLLVLLGVDPLPPDLRPTVEVRRPGVSVIEEPGLLASDEAQVWVQRSSATTVQAPLIPGTTVLVGDSFGETVHRLLSPFFEHLITVRLDQVVAQTGQFTASDLVAEAPDRVILEQVLRTFHSNPGHYVGLFETVDALASVGSN